MGEFSMRAAWSTLITCVLALLAGCYASTSMSSRTNPEFTGKRISKVMVLTTFQDLELQEALDIKLKQSFDAYSVQCLSESDVAFDISSLPIEKVIEIIDAKGIDAILIIGPTLSGTSETYIPKQSVTKEKGSGRIDQFGNLTYSAKTTTQEYGGYYVDKPWANFEASMFDTKTFEKIWYATAKTKGNALANWKTVVRSMAGQTVAKLAEDNIIGK